MNKLLKISIKNFRSMNDASLEFSKNSPITILTGLNGSGKSTILYMVDFVSSIFRGDINSFLDKHGWTSTDIINKNNTPKKFIIEMSVHGMIDDKYFVWSASYNTTSNYNRCTIEKIKLNEIEEYFKSENRRISFFNTSKEALIKPKEALINFKYTGSVLSQLDLESFSEDILKIYKLISSIHSYDLLCPSIIKLKRARISQDIGTHGELLAGYLAGINQAAQLLLINKIKKFYPYIESYSIKHLRAGWKEFSVSEKFDHSSLNLERASKDINDGTIRLLAIVSSVLFANGMSIFDEIENGFNPYIIENLINLLYQSNNQILLTTHSPEILQYIPDDTAVESIRFVFKEKNGDTGIANLFDYPEAKHKLQILSPGEAYLDLSLEDVTKYFVKQQ